ncbi:hypothetical protein HYDPIDRAFT_30538 [Hydnomerulius pinastri MD-312]|uniref:DUF6535 domain-containing protein n=1 Tax=Hydnomerulius pinastri MD-312 TaxID=994086 RepID=A0A0C9VVV4_9AGAM|nr:hypothetical protein HYDPIDRAFT_30538 [Hydnomerulius pinastri MD-312]
MVTHALRAMWTNLLRHNDHLSLPLHGPETSKIAGFRLWASNLDYSSAAHQGHLPPVIVNSGSLAMDDSEGDRQAGADVNNSHGRPSLTGWARIEEFFGRLDKSMVDDFNDDINILLTFAGLFSSVLTAFILQFCSLLQIDNSQATADLLAQLVSLQMGNLSSPSAVQSGPEQFKPPSSSVWINALWFLSLVLSLASALFGMMAKQWLREYMQWTTMMSLPEDAVLVRQLRYEAFMDWNTPAMLASIPALLEVAVILFLLGMVILLYTLNDVVADICTAYWSSSHANQ